MPTIIDFESRFKVVVLFTSSQTRGQLQQAARQILPAMMSSAASKMASKFPDVFEMIGGNSTLSLIDKGDGRWQYYQQLGYIGDTDIEVKSEIEIDQDDVVHDFSVLAIDEFESRGATNFISHLTLSTGTEIIIGKPSG